jgi:hypothetical protein
VSKKPMAKKRTKAGAPQARAGKKTAKSTAGAQAGNAPVPAADAASERFVKDLLVRGEAVPETPGQRLPLQATHKITKQNKDGTATVERVRFKLF